MELYGLTPSDGMNVFRAQRKNEIDDYSAVELSKLVHCHSLSLQPGGILDNCDEPMDEFFYNIYKGCWKRSATERHELINCLEQTADNLRY